MGVGGMFLDGGDAGALGLGVNVMAEVPGGMVYGTWTHHEEPDEDQAHELRQLLMHHHHRSHQN